MRAGDGLKRGWYPTWLDIVVVVLLAVYGQVELAVTHRSGPVSVPMSLVITGSLLWRRRWPAGSALVVVGVFGLQVVFLDPAPQVLANSLAMLVAVYTSAACGGPKTGVPVLVLAAISFIAFETDQRTQPSIVGDAVITVAVSAIGWFVWRRRRQIDDQFAAVGAELRSADSRTADALAEERRRIARELHDVVSHAVTVVVLQARGGRLMLTRDPEQTRVALDAIEQSGQEALAEMRRLVTLLREPSRDTAPQPGLRDLDALVAAAVESGAQVGLAIHGDVVPLSPGIELTAYRLVQEALTNALNHAPGAEVTVDVDYLPSTLSLRVSNATTTRIPAGEGGYGLCGMRERVELYGGTLEYGREGVRWTVHGTLPYTEVPAPQHLDQFGQAARVREA